MAGHRVESYRGSEARKEAEMRHSGGSILQRRVLCLRAEGQGFCPETKAADYSAGLPPDLRAALGHGQSSLR